MAPPRLTEFETGVLVGVLLGQGHFGGDGRYPQVILRMHVRHERLLRWLDGAFPRSKLYGPYHHGDRHYFQWSIRGVALGSDLLPILEASAVEEFDDHATQRIRTMQENYAAFIARTRQRVAA